MSAIPKPYFRPEEYLELDGLSNVRYEYYNGEIVAMTGASVEHNQITTNLILTIGTQLDTKGCDIYVNDLRVRVEATGAYTYPDAVIVCGKKELDTTSVDTLLNPTILIEILSDSTESYDRSTKWAHYRRIATLQEFLLVSQTEYRVEQYIRQEEEVWQYIVYEGAEAVIHLPTVRLNLPLQALYRKVLPSDVL
jgi:Uma2 family endonuclease